MFTCHQRCHGSQAIELVFARPSGLNGVGEEVKLVSLGCKTKWSVTGWSGWGKEQVLLKFARLPNA